MSLNTDTLLAEITLEKKRIQEGKNSEYEQKTIICKSTNKGDVEEFDKTCTKMVKEGWRTIDLLVVGGKLARVFYLSEAERAIKNIVEEKKSVTKVFISLPMNGLSDEKIKSRQKELAEEIKNHIPNALIVNTYISEDPPKNCNIGVWYLGKSLKMLSQCDLAVFAMGWEQARGCWIEYETCKRYGIPVKFEIPDLRD